ncbi:hypothetical protein QZH41_014958 [Actinostola sp. cb2023]|nr:hypothetical protein QZH41_014958 [Actinostola sp. cb2023]
MVVEHRSSPTSSSPSPSTIIIITIITIIDMLMRAVRLMVDVGLHSRGMTRDQATKIMSKYLWDDNDRISKELTRYQSVPAQSLTYMIGRLEILKIREKTKKKLGSKFNIKISISIFCAKAHHRLATLTRLWTSTRAVSSITNRMDVTSIIVVIIIVIIIIVIIINTIIIIIIVVNTIIIIVIIIITVIIIIIVIIIITVIIIIVVIIIVIVIIVIIIINIITSTTIPARSELLYLSSPFPLPTDTDIGLVVGPRPKPTGARITARSQEDENWALTTETIATGTVL